MRRSVRIGIPVLVVICLIGGGFFLVKQKKKELGQTPAYGARPRPVTVAAAEKGDLAPGKTIPGRGGAGQAGADFCPGDRGD
ncbi:MAG: hypothetical protein ACOCUC_00265 [bacterium]